MRPSIATLPLVATAIFMLTSCGNPQVTGEAPGEVAGVSTPAPSQQPDPAELVFLFQKQRDPLEVKDAADKLAKFLSNEIGIPVRYEIPTQYSASVQALVSKTADIAYVSAIPFLLAKRDGGAQLIAVEERTDITGRGRTDYDSVLVVRKDSALQSFDDLVKQAKSIRMSFTSTQSTSGYVMPYGRFVQRGLIKLREDPRTAFASVVFAGSYDAAVREVIAGRADVAAVSHYVIEGDTATNYLSEDELGQIRILERIPGVPTHLVCVRAGLSEDLKARIQRALVKVSDDAPELLSDVYGAKKLLASTGEDHVTAAAEAVQLLGVDMKGLVP